VTIWRLSTAVLFAGTTPVIGSVPVPAADSPHIVEIVAKRFAFEPEQIDVAVGEPVRLVLRSADVTHGFEIDGYDVKVKIPKGGEPVRVDFVAERPGRFRVKCSEYCGSGHRRMRGEMVVRAAEGGAR